MSETADCHQQRYTFCHKELPNELLALVEPLMSESEPTREVASYSISQLASTYHFSCNKLIQLSARKGKPNSNIHPSRSVEAHFLRGEQFELALKDSLSNVKDHTHSDLSAVKSILQAAHPDDCLYQLRLQVPEMWYEENGIGLAYSIRNFIPDFIFVRGDHRHHTLQIIDAKAAKGTTISHQASLLLRVQVITKWATTDPNLTHLFAICLLWFQVASYVFFLKHIIKNLRGIEISTSGGVWLSSEPDKPRLFRLDFLYLKIEQFYTTELPEILREKPVSWLYNSKCRGCDFTQM